MNAKSRTPRGARGADHLDERERRALVRRRETQPRADDGREQPDAGAHQHRARDRQVLKAGGDDQWHEERADAEEDTEEVQRAAALVWEDVGHERIGCDIAARRRRGQGAPRRLPPRQTRVPA